MPGELIHTHDQDLEATLLGSILVWPDHMNEPWCAIPDEAFYIDSHRTWWREVRRQHHTDGGFDATTLAAAFRERGEYDTFHDVFLRILGQQLGDYHPTSYYAPAYARRLKRLYVMREKARAVRKFEQQTRDDPENPDARLELEMVLHVLDEMLADGHERTDEQLAREMGPEGRYEIGFPDLDRLTGGFARPGFNVVAARPSVGKSAFARTVIRKAAARGDRVLWYSKDQSENQIFELEMARAMRVDTTAIRALDHQRRVAGIKHVRQDIWHGNVTLVDRPIPLTQLLTLAKADLPDLMVIDYLQILDTGHDDEYDRITQASIALKTLAFQLRIPILALAQFNRGHQQGKPSMSNLRGSGQIEQDADQIYALDRDTTLQTDQAQEATIYVLKNKVGGSGSAKLHWHGRYASYESAARTGFTS